VHHHGSDSEIEDVVSGRCSARDEHGENHHLERIRQDASTMAVRKRGPGETMMVSSIMTELLSCWMQILTEPKPSSEDPGLATLAKSFGIFSAIRTFGRSAFRCKNVFDDLRHSVSPETCVLVLAMTVCSFGEARSSKQIR
jgi:hypothetical protein